MTPKQYQEIKKEQEKVIEIANKTIDRALLLAKECPFPNNLREACPADIIIGAIIYYPGNDYHNPFWKIIDEVALPGDEFKAYTANDGCRYGLNGAFVKGE